jgi:hypothetical protein
MVIFIDSRLRDNVVVTLKYKEKIVRSVNCYDPAEGVKQILDDCKLAVKDIEKFELVNYPGSFTGLKIGASAVNAFNFYLGNIKTEKDIVLPDYGKDPNITIRQPRN